jgi:hypothetical protein
MSTARKCILQRREICLAKDIWGPNRAATAPAEIQPVSDQGTVCATRGRKGTIGVRLIGRRIELPFSARD